MQLGPITLATAFAAALLVAEHFALWNDPWHAKEPWNYVIGVITLAMGWLLWGLSATGPVAPIDAAISMVLISFGAGASVVLCYVGRGLAEKVKKNNQDIFKARKLTQDIIDQGERHAARQSDIHDPSRRN